MFAKIKPVYVVIIVMGIIIFLQYTFSSTPKPCPECPTFDTTAFLSELTIKYDSSAYKPIHDTILDTLYLDKEIIITNEIPADIDSLAVAMAYYTVRFSSDTLAWDTNAHIVVNDWLFMNKIQKRVISPFEIYPHLTTVTKTVKIPYEPRFVLKVGFGVGGWDDKFGASLKVLAVTKSDQTYGASYDFINNFAEVSLYWTIRFKKR